MEKKLPCILLLLIVLCCQISFSQTTRQFKPDPLLFAGEINGFMGPNLTGEQSVKLEKFIGQWDSAMFNTSEMQAIMHTANLLRERNARPLPHMLNYLDMLNAFSEHDPGRRHYPVWQKAFTNLLEKGSLPMGVINELMLLMGGLVSQNVLYSSVAVNWEVSEPNFSLVFDDSLRIVFPETDLRGYNHIDTITVFRTSGTLCPLSLTWKGRGGRVTWERAGLDAREAYAVPGGYTIDLKRSEYSSDSASFNFSRYFQLPIQGKLTDRVLTSNNSINASYPRFASYRQEFKIMEIYPGIDYEGGLSMNGAKLIGSGGEEGNARLVFHRDGEIRLKAESRHFVFSPQGVSSLNTSIVFYLENDSVFHPDLHLNYIENSRELSLNQNDKVISQSPWDNHFHKIDMSFAQLLWKIDEPELVFTMPRASSIGSANFKSLNFFDRQHYQRLQGMDMNHPLLHLRTFAGAHDSGAFPAEDYARYLRMPLPGVRHQLLELTLGGFIFYDTDTDLVRTRQKLYDYLLANIRRIDYDIIDFSSTTSAPQANAILDLNSLELTVNGIPRVYISNTQNVNLFPENNSIIMRRNRNFLFDGNINAGNLSFFGTNFAFDYDRFTINLQNVDSLSMRVRLDETNLQGQARLVSVKNLIRSVSGELSVDQPNNKSGRVSHPDFPKFSSTGNSYVFYDHPHIHKGVYRQDDFYFKLYPFTLDSLNTFSNEELRFRGSLISAGIFPDIEDMLTIQDDFSLGINHTAPETGLPVYKGKGAYFHDLNLSNAGLRGSGKLDYLTSVLYSEDFLFLPDSMNTTTNDFFVEKQITGIQFPAVSSQNNYVQWLPDEDLMVVLQKDEGFSMFNDQAGLRGSLNITPSGMSGSGSFSLDNAEISSDDYIFRAESFNASNSRFVLHNPDKTAIALHAGGLDSFIDLEMRRGEFSMIRGSGMVTLPVNEFMADADNFTWEMDRQEFELTSSRIHPVSGLAGAEYISKRNGQDSLRFISPFVVFNYRNHLLKAGEVKYLEIADAMIFPADETIQIGENAEIFPLKDARVIAGTGSFHEIHNADLKITARNKYAGSGNYEYIDEMNEVLTINFSKISVSEDSETIASGNIDEEDNFMLSPHFIFKGEAELAASRPHLNFRGSVRTTHNCDGLNDHWLAFENVLDPMEVLIPVPAQPVSGDRLRLYSGVLVATDSIHLYPAFFSERKNYADQLIVRAEGYMKFDRVSGEYRIASIDKLRDHTLPGNQVSLDPKECMLRGEGQLELGVAFGQFKLNAVGTVQNKINGNQTNIKGIVTLDFPFSDDALALIAREADSLPGEPMDSREYYFDRGLNELLGQERAEQFRSSPASREGRQARLPEELQKTIVLSHVNLRWDEQSRSYISQGKIGIANINGAPVNKMFTGYLEITKRRSGDYLDFYVEMENNNWYYFGYTRGVMQAYSSNRAFVNIIDDMAVRHRRDRGPAQEERYVYMLASNTKLEQFFKTYHRHMESKDDHVTRVEAEGEPEEPGQMTREER
jgi:hypothetical protein